MIFWTAKPDQKQLPGLRRDYDFNSSRVIWAIIIVAVLVGVAYGFHLLNWDPGQNLFLTLAQTVAGVVIGVLTGEGTASRELSNPGTG
jgi:hypothetical protein